MHWGEEYQATPSQLQRQQATQILASPDVDAIVGGHVHVVQPVEKYHDCWVAYSLGNFIFDQQGPNTHRGLLLKATVRDRHVVDVQSIPIDINSSFQAKLAPTLDHPARPVLVEQKTTEISTQ